MFRKVLVANRGEIAVRVVRACRELGIPSVAVYSSADAESTAVRMADERVHIGPGPSAKSYLHIPNVIGAALKTGADAIHPGYGFLSEDPFFAEICAGHGITFIGPPPSVMELVGNKPEARAAMADAGLPLLDGTVEAVATLDDARLQAGAIGYPVILKATAGGGGRGMTVVDRPQQLEHAYRSTRASAQAVFKNSAVYLERYLRSPSHVEVQILRDAYGNAIHLGERDCSIQRRHQKLIEEAPSPRIDARLREAMAAAALDGVSAIGYVGAGTVEFLVDGDGTFTFMEINARIQVEHPVTEMVTGVDLVQEQIRIAAGERLSLSQYDVHLTGHVIECRINAEDPDRDFVPTPGRIDTWVTPDGPWTRVDSHGYSGWTIAPHYDSLLAKLIVWGHDRTRAIDRMRRALREFAIDGPGVKTTIGFHQNVIDHPAFRAGDFTTDFVERHLGEP